MFKLYVITIFVCFIGIIIFDIRMSERIKLKGYKCTRKRTSFMDLLATIFMSLVLSPIPLFNLYFLFLFICYDENVIIRQRLDRGEIYYDGDL